ncbi:hypothetical protein GCM10023175_53690 [Pseudonocardia xishanensis]|uniref:Gluconate 2-dehydrogenase subunit 3-like protein n=1 Tax=Pseudonocardia xishanensis TaxID=630995 RepID=A0ABP8RZC0_9PSEU
MGLPGEPGPITVPVERYLRRLPAGSWPAGLPGSGPLWRADVFAVAASWRRGSASARDLTVAALLWGFGPTAYGPHRTERILAADPDGTRLARGLEPLRADELTKETLQAAYVSFRRGQSAYVRGLGPAFFTKLIYFAGYRRGRGGVQPLILDKVVAGRLPVSAGPARRSSWGWRSADWIAYLQWAASTAQDPRFDGEPERVEMALFAGTARLGQ